MAQKHPPHYEPHYENGESASNSLFLDLLLHHSDQAEQLADSIFHHVEAAKLKSTCTLRILKDILSADSDIEQSICAYRKVG